MASFKSNLKKTLAVLALMLGLTLFSGAAYAQFGPDFSIPQHYPPTNDTALELLVMNSTGFKERTAGYNYTLAGIDYDWVPKGNNYHDLGGAKITFLVSGFGNATVKGDAFNLDSHMKVRNVFEYDATRPPAGYRSVHCAGICKPWVNPEKPMAKLKTIESPLMQSKPGVTTSDIHCNNDLVLVIRAEDSSTACVKIDTAFTLIKRGWAASESVYPGHDPQFALFTNSTIIPGHLPHSSGVRIPYEEWSQIINYNSFTGAYNATLLGRGTQPDFVLKPGNTGTLTFEIYAQASEWHGGPYPVPLPRSLNLTNYAVFIHEVTSIQELAKYPGVTFNGNHDFSACFTRPESGGTCLGEIYDGKTPIEAYVTDHPGVNVLFEPPSEVLQLGNNPASQNITMTITIDKNAPKGTYLVELDPFGLGSFLLTIGDRPYLDSWQLPSQILSPMFTANPARQPNADAISNNNPNYTLQSSSPPPYQSNQNFTMVKFPGYDMSFIAIVKNPASISGDSIDPKGTFHQMNLAPANNGTVKLSYYAPTSDPPGVYTVHVHIVKGKDTQVISMGAGYTQKIPPPTYHPAIHLKCDNLTAKKDPFDCTR